MSLGVIAAAAGTLFSSSAGLTIIGGIAAGIGGALSARAERKAAEKERIAEEMRREARYKGVGEATRLNEDAAVGEGDPTVATNVTEQRAKAQKQSTTPLGFREVTQKMGSQFKNAVSGAPAANGFAAATKTIGR